MPIKIEPRLKNWYRWREAQPSEVPWLRPPDLSGHTLPRPIVVVNGAFDLLHRSHMRILFAARHKGATVVCALDSDEKVQREKDTSRPVLDWIERATTLNYMPVDLIVEIGSQRDMDELMRNLQPNLRVQGEEYFKKPSRYKVKRMFVRDGNIHTSEIINRIKAGNETPKP